MKIIRAYLQLGRVLRARSERLGYRLGLLLCGYRKSPADLDCERDG